MDRCMMFLKETRDLSVQLLLELMMHMMHGVIPKQTSFIHFLSEFWAWRHGVIRSAQVFLTSLADDAWYFI